MFLHVGDTKSPDMLKHIMCIFNRIVVIFGRQPCTSPPELKCRSQLHGLYLAYTKHTLVLNLPPVRIDHVSHRAKRFLQFIANFNCVLALSSNSDKET